jgi:hypothetical protein
MSELVLTPNAESADSDPIMSCRLMGLAWLQMRDACLQPSPTLVDSSANTRQDIQEQSNAKY